MNLYFRLLKLKSEEYVANFKTMQDFIKNEEIFDLLIFSISNIKNENIEIYGDFLNLIEGKKENNNCDQLSKKMKAEINYINL